MKFRSVLLPRKNAQNAPTTPETIITPIAKILVENKVELANIVFSQGKPTFALAKFHKDKYLQISSIYLPVYLLWLLKTKNLPRILHTFSVFMYPVHKKDLTSSSNPHTITSQLPLKNEGTKSITHKKTN